MDGQKFGIGEIKRHLASAWRWVQQAVVGGTGHGMNVIKRWPQAMRWSAGMGIAVFVLILFFFAQPDWDWARGITAATLSARLHRPVSINGHIRVALFSASPTIILDGVKVAEPQSGMPDAPKRNLAEIDSLVAQPEILPLLMGQLRLRRLEFQRPSIVMFQDAAGRSNWDFSDGRNAQAASKLPPVETLIVRNGVASVTMIKRRLAVVGQVTADARSGFRFVGSGTQDGKPCTVITAGPQLGRARRGAFYPFEVTLKAGQTQIVANGRFLHPFDFGQISADLHLRGASLSDLYYLLSVTAPNTPAFDLSVHVDRNQKLYKISAIHGRIGSSDLEGTMTVDRRGARPKLTADFSSHLLDLADLGSSLGASKANAPHRPRMAMMPRMGGPASRLMPDAPLDVDRLRAGDASVRYRALSIHATPDMPAHDLSFSAQLDNGLLRFDPIRVGFQKGEAKGQVVIDARGRTQHDALDLVVTGLRLEAFAKTTGTPPLEGPLSAELHVTGVGNSARAAAASANGTLRLVIPGGTIRQSLAEAMGINASKSLFLFLAKDPHQTDIRCGVADFQIHNGIMQARQIVLDTGVVLVTGTGSVNLKDESLNIALRGKPKTFRLIRINAPIVIGGHLTQPVFGISAGPAAAQGGLAALAGSVLPLLPFDYAKDVDCRALTEGSVRGR